MLGDEWEEGVEEGYSPQSNLDNTTSTGEYV